MFVSVAVMMLDNIENDTPESSGGGVVGFPDPVGVSEHAYKTNPNINDNPVILFVCFENF
jgi:hypothetical protein